MSKIDSVSGHASRQSSKSPESLMEEQPTCLTRAVVVSTVDLTKFILSMWSFMLNRWSPTGKVRGLLSDAHVGRHPGHTMAHSSTAKGHGLLLPG